MSDAPMSSNDPGICGPDRDSWYAPEDDDGARELTEAQELLSLDPAYEQWLGEIAAHEPLPEE